MSNRIDYIDSSLIDSVSGWRCFASRRENPMLTTVLALGKKDIYLSCGHRIRNSKVNPMHLKVNQVFNCYQCDRGKKLHGKPIKETRTWKAKSESDK